MSEWNDWMKEQAANGSHTFKATTNPNFPLACVRCGRTREHHPSEPKELRAITRMREYVASLGERKHDEH